MSTPLPSVFERLFSLAGCRHNDPGLLALLKELKVKPPRAATPTSPTQVSDKTHLFEMTLRPELRLPGFYPPRKENGQYLTYNTMCFIKAASEIFPVEMPRTEPLAKKVALQVFTTEAMIFNLYLWRREGPRECWLVFRKDNHELQECRLKLAELEKDDPRLQEPPPSSETKVARKRALPVGVPSSEP